MDIKKLREPIPIKSVDFRIQSINKGGYATILAYKDARVDQQRLDDVVGPLNWKREHTNGNRNCIVSIWDESKSQWVSKEDTGTESNTEKEKGLASDSFKRACFNWGIGRELYDYPIIQIKLHGDGYGNTGDEWKIVNYQGKEIAKATWYLRLKEWKWYAEFENGKVTFLAAQDVAGKTRFTYGERKK